MPRENFGPGHTFLAKEEILTYEEMAKVVSSLLPLGLKKVRITGGEPLLRKDIHVLIELLRSLDPELDLALTTNGILLHKYADILYQKGLNRVTVSLDAVEPEMFQQITEMPHLLFLCFLIFACTSNGLCASSRLLAAGLPQCQRP